MQSKLKEVKKRLSKHFSNESKISGNSVKIHRKEFFQEDLQFFVDNDKELKTITMIKRSGKGVTAIITSLI